MEKKRPFYKRWYFWVVIVIWFIVLANIGKKNSAPAQVTAPEPEVQAEADESIEDQITTAIDSLNFNYSDLKVIEGMESLKVSLHYDDTAWDETRLVSNCLTDYVNLCTDLYSRDGITKVEYYVFCDLTDTRGNKVTEKAFAMCMTKENFDKYTWDNIKFTEGTYSQIESDSEYIDIHAGIKKNVDFNKVYYKG